MAMIGSRSVNGVAVGAVRRASAPRGLRPLVSRRSLASRVRAEARSDGQEFGLAPSKPRTPFGEMLQYYLRMQPQLFQATVEQQLTRLRDEREKRLAAGDAPPAPPQLPPATAAADSPPHPELEGGDAEGSEAGPADMVLYQRMEEVRALEVRATVEDLMYVSILEKFILLGVEMLPRLDGFVDPGPANLVALTEGVHSKEALELVREHLLGVMGPAAGRQFSSELIKMSKFQIAQVYAASVMFGYFLRRVDKRFQLEKALGTIQEGGGSPGLSAGAAAGIMEPPPTAADESDSKEGGAPALERSKSVDEAVARLEALFQKADDVETASDPDSVDASVYEVGASMAEDDGGAAAARRAEGALAGASGRGASDVGGGGSEGGLRPQKSALRRYVEGFDQATMIETARVVSAEGAALVERQTSALFGDIKELTRQMQDAVGGGVGSAEELYARIQAAVANNKIETVTMTVATQRRCVLEAVAFGSFLRDVEGGVTEYGLLTPLGRPNLPPGSP